MVNLNRNTIHDDFIILMGRRRIEGRLIVNSKKEAFKMSVVKVVEILAESNEGWEAAAQKAVEEVSKTVKNVTSVYVKDFQAIVEDGKIVKYRVNVKVSFIVE